MFKTSSGGAKNDEHPYIQTHSEKEAATGAHKPGKEGVRIPDELCENILYETLQEARISRGRIF